MSSAFLDNGVVLAYCVVVHRFHPECDEYIEGSDSDLYITQEINSIYENKKDEIIQDLSTSVLEHQADIKRGEFPEQFGPVDIRDAKRMIHSNNSARRFLLNWYEEEVGQFITKYELTEKLRNLAGDIEQRAMDRKSDFDDHVEIWERDSNEDYPEVQADLRELREDKEEDMWVCIDAHDLAKNVDGQTILATTDLNDFIREGRREMILNATALDKIQPLGNVSP